MYTKWPVLVCTFRVLLVMKFLRGVHCVTSIGWIDFGGDPDYVADTGIS